MCQICKNAMQTHVAYIKHRDKKNELAHIGDHWFSGYYQFSLGKAEAETHKSVASLAKNGSCAITHEDFAAINMTAEKDAISFAQSKYHVESLKEQLAFAKEVEALRAALSLIQARAVVLCSPEIQKIAEDALKQESFISQGSAELQAILDKKPENWPH